MKNILLRFIIAIIIILLIPIMLVLCVGTIPIIVGGPIIWILTGKDMLNNYTDFLIIIPRKILNLINKLSEK